MTGEASQGKGGAGSGAVSTSMGAGRVGRAHGLDGSFYVTRPRARLLSLGVEVTVAGNTVAIVRRAGTDQHPILRLEGIDSREAAEALRGSELTLDSGDVPRLAEGEWWAHELEGCAVLDGGRRVGTVKRMIELPSCEALEVLPVDGGAPLLVPMVRDAIRGVDPAGRRIEVVASFLDLGAVEQSAEIDTGATGGKPR